MISIKFLINTFTEVWTVIFFSLKMYPTAILSADMRLIAAGFNNISPEKVAHITKFRVATMLTTYV